ncbi:MAG: hypothetical protein ACK5PQ_01075 [Alphaproteobacteria bacterium]
MIEKVVLNSGFLALVLGLLWECTAQGALRDEDITEPRRPVSVRKGKDDYLKANNLFGSAINTQQLWRQVYELVQYSPGKSSNDAWHPGKKRKAEPTREKGKIDEYLYFPLNEGNNHKPKSFYLVSSASGERLDIQNWNVRQGGQYVQIQLQIGTGQKIGNCLASINVRKGVFYAPQHIMHCLWESYKTGTATSNPETINTDDPRFGR